MSIKQSISYSRLRQRFDKDASYLIPLLNTGLQGLVGETSPVRHPAKRRRLRTVMQEKIGIAGRMLQRGRCVVLRFGHHCPGYWAYRQLEILLS